MMGRGAIVPPEAVPHGSLAGYRWHKNHDEEPCRPCKLAWNKYQLQHKANPVTKRRLRKKDVTGG